MTCAVTGTPAHIDLDIETPGPPITVTLEVTPDGGKGEVNAADNTTVINLVP